MFDLAGFIAEAQRASEASDPTGALQEVVYRAVRTPADVARAVPVMEEEEVLLHVCPTLTVVHVRLTPNVHFPPHEHGMPAVIGLYQGEERSITYGERPHGLEQVAVTDYQAGEVVALGPAGIHSVLNRGTSRSAGLHVYGGDLLQQPRRIWHPQTHRTMPYSDESYFALARPFSPERPFARPKLCHAHQSSDQRS